MPIQRTGGFTLVELMVVLAVLFLFAVLLDIDYPTRNVKQRALRIQCANNLKQTGLACRIWAEDHSRNYPMSVSEKIGGAMELTFGPNAFRSMQVLSNELSTPKVLFCPAESDGSRIAATNFNLSNSNLSYFVGLDAIETNATMILSGDRNITNGTPIQNGLLELTTNAASGWTSEIHKTVGNILLTDGSVQQESMTGLRWQIANTGVRTNRALMPVLGPQQL